MFGAGCWAQQVKHSYGERGVACSLSGKLVFFTYSQVPRISWLVVLGSGEYITRMHLAKTIGEAIVRDVDPDVHEILTRTLEEFYSEYQQTSRQIISDLYSFKPCAATVVKVSLAQGSY